MISCTGQTSLEFNKGSDARLRGERVTTNPHAGSTYEYYMWRLGWLDVERCWGKEAKWPVAKLAEVA